MIFFIFYHCFLIASIILLTITASRAVNRIIRRYMPQNNIHATFLCSITTGVVYFAGFVVSLSTIPALQTMAYSLLASSSVLAVFVGLASQQLFSNLINGLFITMAEPFSIGDRIRMIKDKTTYEGIVIDINMRHTTIKTDDQNTVLVPNTFVNTEIIEKINKK